MARMEKMNTKDFDLNSLLILNAVIECKSVTIAAKKMAMSPSSVTYAINKIRKTTANPIFTRSKNGITPTTLALELNRRYIKAISLINDGLDFSGSLQDPDVFRNVTISTHTFLEMWFALSSAASGSQEGLCFNFVAHPPTREKRVSRLRNHEVDLDIGGMLPNDASIISHKLFSSRFKVLVRKKHSTIRDEFTLKDWEQNRHIRWKLPDDETLIQEGDAYQTDALLSRKTGITTANSLSAVMTCAKSDYIMLVPGCMEDFLVSTLPVRLFELPFDTTMAITVYAHFHRSAKRKEFTAACINTLLSMTAPQPEE
ncbi:LysR family transcriptional regulator [Klebsiella aerogenes]|uniref:LysR family transcriptional regulator n=1 Tax=Klebsiella aerogenes TaxID=548 RepID=UPI00379E2E4A